MKEYDLISIGTGSAMNIVDIMVQENPKMNVAVIDKDEPGADNQETVSERFQTSIKIGKRRYQDSNLFQVVLQDK